MATLDHEINFKYNCHDTSADVLVAEPAQESLLNLPVSKEVGSTFFQFNMSVYTFRIRRRMKNLIIVRGVMLLSEL